MSYALSLSTPPVYGEVGFHRFCESAKLPVPPAKPASKAAALRGSDRVVREQGDPTGAAGRRDLGIGDTELPDQAFERIGATRRDRDARHVDARRRRGQIGHALRQRGLRDIDREILTRGDVRHLQLTPPLAHLHDERDVARRRHTAECEVTGLVGDGRDDRAAPQPIGAARARRAVGERPRIGFGNVDVDPEQRQRSVGCVHRSGDRRRRQAFRFAIDLKATQTYAGVGRDRSVGQRWITFGFVVVSAGGEEDQYSYAASDHWHHHTTSITIRDRRVSSHGKCRVQ